MKLLLRINKFFKNKLVRQLFFLFALIGVLGLFFLWKNTQVLPQGAASMLSKMPEPWANQNIVIFAPHPDDESLAASGYIRQAILNSAHVYIVLVTDGNRRHLKDKRYSEFESATSLLGISSDNLIFLGYPDGKMKDQSLSELADKFKQIISQINPQVVIYPIIQDHHSDHRVIGLVLSTLLSSYPDINSYGYLVHNSYYPQPLGLHKDLYLMPPLSLLRYGWTWYSFDLTSKSEEVKWQAISQYKTQFKNEVLKDIMPAFVRKNEIFVSANK